MNRGTRKSLDERERGGERQAVNERLWNLLGWPVCASQSGWNFSNEAIWQTNNRNRIVPYARDAKRLREQTPIHRNPRVEIRGGRGTSKQNRWTGIVF